MTNQLPLLYMIPTSNTLGTRIERSSMAISPYSESNLSRIAFISVEHSYDQNYACEPDFLFSSNREAEEKELDVATFP